MPSRPSTPQLASQSLPSLNGTLAAPNQDKDKTKKELPKIVFRVVPDGRGLLRERLASRGSDEDGLMRAFGCEWLQPSSLSSP